MKKRILVEKEAEQMGEWREKESLGGRKEGGRGGRRTEAIIALSYNLAVTYISLSLLGPNVTKHQTA